MKLTTQLELQSQTTRLYEHVSYAANSSVLDGILTLPDALFQETSIQVTRWLHVETLHLDTTAWMTDFQLELYSLHSPLLRVS